MKLFMGKHYGNCLIRNRKGSFQDLIQVMVILIFFAIVVLVSNNVLDQLNDQFQTSPLTNTTEGKEASATLLGYYSGVVDNTFLFLVIGLAIVTLVLAAMVRIHPIFVPFFFIGWVILIFVSGIISNIYQELAAQTEYIAIANQLTFITNVLTYLPIFIAVLGMALMVVMYKQWQIAQQF